MALLVLVVLAMMPVMTSAEVIITPSTTTPNANVSTNFTISVNITSHDSSIYTNVKFNSTYLVGFSPAGAVLDNGSMETFTLTLDIPEFYGSVNSTIVNDTVRTYATNASVEISLGAFVLSINLSLQNSNLTLREYFFKKCFFENSSEFCSAFNISDVQNVTILNQTVTYQNVTWDLMIPYNLTKQFMESYAGKMQSMAEDVNASRAAIQNATDTMIYIQNRTDNKYKNAIMIEGFLKNPNTDLWFQVFPANMLLNASGLDINGFNDAISYLYQMGKLQQKTEIKQVSLTMADGSIITKNMNIITVASSERVIQVESDTFQMNLVIASILIAVVSMGIVLFLPTWKRRVKFRRG